MRENSIPLIDVTTQNKPFKEEVLQALEQIIDRSAFVMGEEVTKFESEFLAYTGVKHAVSCASGTDALLVPLMSAGIGPGDEVLVPSFTFYATVASVVRVGAIPIFIDSDNSYNLSLEEVEKKISTKTKAIIPVHLFGRMVDMKKLQQIIANAKQKITIIEDCAQSMGASIDGKQAGTWGDYGSFSFYPTKNLGAMGDAGMISCKDESDCRELKMIRVHGSEQRYYHERIGFNSRLDSFQAAILRIKMRKLKEFEQERNRVAQEYFRYFAETKLDEFIRLPMKTKENEYSVWNQFTIRAKKRDDLKKFLSEQKIGSEIYYPLAMHKQRAFSNYVGKENLSTCEELEREVLSLPIFPELSNESVSRVVDALDAFYKKQ
ncbi:MAG: DegT/DnrJ/EryC1/StrS family aminotransferase [Oligoflexia bacterium]|nr:DegT/DnrJ/EryC1/StrS family aminotransferase [Oligoflexia bacterium]